eukprot:TRINITY_DN19574_c0_g1_i2.p1 TRINITY_DN19574_c0_g1~~TRINITY_DN19574_c0_g1_i2.p1  ORF type:complete len:336 (+),score=92.93 TRINITY_DN19574_c0_g1_i2:120-1127(+)
MYRYSRGQSGHGSLPRPAWGGGGSSHARAQSPEPAGLASSGGAAAAAGGERGNGAAAGGSSGASAAAAAAEPPRERQDEAILQLENELIELRNACAWRDQRIAELSRVDVPVPRLKHDIRVLAGELRNTRKQLAETIAEKRELSSRLRKAEGRPDASGGGPVETISVTPGVGASSAASGAGGASGADRTALRERERIAELTDENRRMREMIAQLTMQASASAQRASMEQVVGVAAHPGNPGAGVVAGASGGLPAAGAMAPVPTGLQGVGPVEQIVYSSASPEHAATIGPTALQGVGVVENVSDLAKVLLTRIPASVCSMHRRAAGQMPGGMVPGM